MRDRSDLLLMCLLAGTISVHAAETEDFSKAKENDAIASLEKYWVASHSASYFEKAMELIRTRNAKPNASTDFYASQLDIASGALLRSFAGVEFGLDASAVRNCQAEIIKQIVALNIVQMNGSPGWSELRAKYGRILMLQRATWQSLRDPDMDGKPIELDSTVRLQSDAAARERVLRNQRIELQVDLKRFLEEIGPATDKFMVTTFSAAPRDMRMFNALLDMGLYAPEERARLTTTVENNFRQH